MFLSFSEKLTVGRCELMKGAAEYGRLLSDFVMPGQL